MHKKCFNLNKLRKYESKPFIYERKAVNKENIYSYKVILQEASKCIGYLQKNQVEKHVGIGITLSEHSASTCILILGILNHDCSFYCLDYEETKDVNTYLKLSGVKYIISSQNLKLKHTKNELKILEDDFHLYLLENDISIFENVEFCYSVATSGSTGLPKMVHVPYECIESNIKMLSNQLNIQEKDMIFLGSPPTFDPFVVELFVALENGASILITSKKMRLQPLLLLHVMFPEMATLKPGVTVYQTTPSLFRLFEKQSIHDVILSKNSTLRCLILGGEDFPSSLELTSWLPLDFLLTGKRIFNIYGITEISCWTSIYEFDAKTKLLDHDRVPLGKPLDEFTFFRLVDEIGNILRHNDCNGELEIGSSVRRCFIPQYDMDVNILKSNDIIYRKTGDHVKRDSLGNIFYIGRTNNTIKRFGKRLCLDSLNKKVEHLLNINNMFYKVISLWQKEPLCLIFYLVNNKKVTSNEKEFIYKVFKENLENCEQPDKIFYNNKLPLNPHGKVDGKMILQQISVPPNSPLKIFKDFLRNVMSFQLDNDRNEAQESLTDTKSLKIFTHLSFLKAGGTSFQALSLATEIAELMEDCIEQHKILELLLDDNTPIEDTLKFLTSCSTKFKTEKTAYKCLKNTNNTRCSLKLLWRCDLRRCVDAAPAIYEDKFISVGSHSHLLLTVNATTGVIISSLELNNRIECPVVFVSSHLALVGCYDGFLYGFNFNSGTVIWKVNAKGMIKAKPLIVKSMIIVASYADFNIVAYDLKSLALLWSLKLGSKGIFSSPVRVAEDSVLFCTLDGTYALIEADTGFIKWCHKLDAPIFSAATKIELSNEIILVIAEVSGKISVCEAESGNRISYFQTEGNVFSGLTLHRADHTNHSLIIFGCHDKHVYCLKIEHASKQLSLFSKFSLNSAVYATPIVILNRYILACSTKGLIVLLSLHESPILLTSYDLKADVFSSPNCLRDKFVYVGSRNNYLYAFHIET